MKQPSMKLTARLFPLVIALSACGGTDNTDPSIQNDGDNSDSVVIDDGDIDGDSGPSSVVIDDNAAFVIEERRYQQYSCGRSDGLRTGEADPRGC